MDGFLIDGRRDGELARRDERRHSHCWLVFE
jgi:hypothetical protein